MNVLVTGGAGYIGSHTVVELLQRGHHPVIADNLSNAREEVISSIKAITGNDVPFYNIDLCDKDASATLFHSQKIDSIIHFAAFKAVGESVQHPLKYYRNNLFSLINLLDLVEEHHIKNFVFSSSCSVYGQAAELPVKETTPLAPAESPYGNTKRIGEEILRDTLRNAQFNCIALRYFNPAGAHPSALIGEYPLQAPNNLVPVITQTAIGKRGSLTVFGNDYNTADGTCIRDFIHVVDLAKAHVSAIERLRDKKEISAFEIFNLGTGKGSTVLEVIRSFENTTGVKLNYTIGPRRPGDVEKVWADTNLAEKTLDWKAELSLDEIMRSAWAWEKNMSSQ